MEENMVTVDVTVFARLIRENATMTEQIRYMEKMLNEDKYMSAKDLRRIFDLMDSEE